MVPAHGLGEIRADGGPCLFDLGDGNSGIGELIEGQISRQDKPFIVLPAEQNGSDPTTFRWGYRIRIR